MAYLDESHKWKRTFIVVFLRNNPAPIERLIEGLNKDLQSKPEENNRLKKEAYRWKNRVWFEHLTGSEARIWKPTQEITTNTNTARICLPSISILFWKRSEHYNKREMKALVNPRNVERVEELTVKSLSRWPRELPHTFSLSVFKFVLVGDTCGARGAIHVSDVLSHMSNHYR